MSAQVRCPLFKQGGPLQGTTSEERLGETDAHESDDHEEVPMPKAIPSCRITPWTPFVHVSVTYDCHCPL